MTRCPLCGHAEIHLPFCRSCRRNQEVLGAISSCARIRGVSVG